MTKKLLLGSFLLFGAFSIYSSKNVVKITCMKAAFTIPTNVAVSNISQTSASVTWDQIAGSTNFQVRLRPVGPYAWMNYMVSNANVFTFTNLQPCTAYEVQVTDTISGDISASVIFYTSLNYCSSASTDTSMMHISNVTVNSTGVTAPMVSNSGSSNYTDYRSDITRRIKFFVGSMGNNLSVTSTWTGAPGTTTVTAWIDLNGNGVFESNERVMVANNVTPAAPAVSVFPIPSFPTLPNSVIGGCGVVMRVISRQTFPTDACGTFTYGEVEDYGVDFIDSTLGIKETDKDLNHVIYPNPASDILNISGISEATNYEIYNAAGQKMGEGKVSDRKVSLHHLSKGVYFIQLKDKENVTRLKFIKK